MSAAQTTEPTRSTAAGQGLAGFEVLDVERVLAEAGGVGGVGEPAAVVGDVGGADGEEGVAFGQLVAVEEDFFERHPCAGRLRPDSAAARLRQ